MGRIAAGTLALSVGLALTSLAPPTRADASAEPDTVAEGRFLYEVYCLNCHGESGKGDGVTAAVLKVRPSDLRRISKRNGGEFPEERIYRIIDGREEIAGHGRRRMPIWGLAFQELDRDTDQEAEVRGRILRLIEYLESIQQPRPEPD